MVSFCDPCFFQWFLAELLEQVCKNGNNNGEKQDLFVCSNICVPKKRYMTSQNFFVTVSARNIERFFLYLFFLPEREKTTRRDHRPLAKAIDRRSLCVFSSCPRKKKQRFPNHQVRRETRRQGLVICIIFLLLQVNALFFREKNGAKNFSSFLAQREKSVEKK